MEKPGHDRPVGCLLANVSSVFMTSDGSLPDALYHQQLWDNFLDSTSPYYHSYGHIMAHGGLIDILYIGVKAGLYPCMIFIGIGAMTDFGPLISNPKSLLLGAAAQFGVFFAFFGANLLGFDAQQSASIGIIGGADGPTAILTTTKLAPDRRRGRPHGHLPDHQARPGAPRRHRHCGLLLHGADPDDPAADHARADHRERAQRQDGAAA